MYHCGGCYGYNPSMGLYPLKIKKPIKRLKIKAVDGLMASHYILVKTKIKARLTPQVVSRIFEVDFAEREYGVILSSQFMKIVEKWLSPLEEKNAQLTNNCPQAEQRLHGLKRDSMPLQGIALIK